MSDPKEHNLFVINWQLTVTGMCMIWAMQQEHKSAAKEL